MEKILLEELNNNGKKIEDENKDGNDSKKNPNKNNEKENEKNDIQLYLFESNSGLNNSVDNPQNTSPNKLNESVEDMFINNNRFSNVNPMRKSLFLKPKNLNQKDIQKKKL